MELKNIYIELAPQKNSKEILLNISQDLEKLFSWKGIEINIQKKHHMTAAYFKKVTEEELIKVIEFFQQQKIEYQGREMLNKNKTFDESVHQVEIWKSNITGETHIVLTPHNPESIYKNFIKSDTISPHINLAKINISKEEGEKIRPEIIRLIRSHIQENWISIDLSDITLHF